MSILATENSSTSHRTSAVIGPAAGGGVPAPHFFLFSEANEPAALPAQQSGQWRFVLESLDGETKVEAHDAEPAASGERLELLAIVRGLEALDQPSRVTLVTSSRYVSRGMRFGLEQWRESDWEWERYGQMTPVKHRDLWQRIDQAMKIHNVECRAWRFDSSDDLREPSLHAEPLSPAKVRRDGSGRTLRFDVPQPKSEGKQFRRKADHAAPWQSRVQAVCAGIFSFFRR